MHSILHNPSYHMQVFVYRERKDLNVCFWPCALVLTRSRRCWTRICSLHRNRIVFGEAIMHEERLYQQVVVGGGGTFHLRQRCLQDAKET
jgi:hypothetical protein